MNYFSAISKRCEELDKLGKAYLDKFEFIPNSDILARLWEIAFDLYKKNGEQFEGLPAWAANFIDGHPPFAPGRNGSLYLSLGTSVISRDAHLRNLLERVEGRETNELDFEIVANHSIVDKYAGL